MNIPSSSWSRKDLVAEIERLRAELDGQLNRNLGDHQNYGVLNAGILAVYSRGCIQFASKGIDEVFGYAGLIEWTGLAWSRRVTGWTRLPCWLQQKRERRPAR
jgi:hypothetical protein